HSRPVSRPHGARGRSGQGSRPVTRKPTCIGCSRGGAVFPRVYPRADHQTAPQPWVHTRRPDFWLDPSWRTPLSPPISTWRTGSEGFLISREEGRRAMPHHLAILTDFPEEGWRSMDLCGDMLLDHLPRDGPFSVEAARLCPPFRRLAARLPAVGRRN